MSQKTIALVTGDGSGPEMMRVACEIAIAAARQDGIEIVFEETPMGWNAYPKYGDTFPEESFRRATELGVLFWGGVGDPKLDKTIGVEHPEMMPEARALMPLRSAWKLLLNFRPLILYKYLAHLAKVRPETIPDAGVRQVWVRFLLEDSYFGNTDLMQSIPQDIRDRLGIKLKAEVTGEEEMITELAYYRKETIEKYFRAIFNYAKLAGLPVISIDKANVMPRYIFWRKVCARIGKDEFPDVPLSHQLVDSANALLFTPTAFNGVIACGNEHGDILSDGAAGAWSLGMMCSSSVNPDTGTAIFESGAGTAADKAGRNEANPLGRILTAAMMLRHIGAPKGAQAIEEAVQKALQQGYRTADLTSSNENITRAVIGTREMGEKVFSLL